MNLITINLNNKHPKVLLVLPEMQHDIRTVFLKYLQPLGSYGTDVHMVTIKVPEKGRMSHDVFKPTDDEIKNYCELNGISVIVTSIPELLRNFLGLQKAYELEKRIGYAEFKDGYTYIPTINYAVLRFAPNKNKLLQRSLSCVSDVLNGEYVDNLSGATDSISYIIPKDFKEAKEALMKYKDLDKLTIDIETNSLRWERGKLLTCSFSPSEEEATVIALPILKDDLKCFALLKNFFKAYKGKCIFHNAVFDIPFLVHKLFMSNIGDTVGMVEGVNSMDIDDTIIMAYLCLNSTDRPSLGLKELAYSKFGDWDADIDQSKLEYMDINKVCEYNGVDTCATMYLYNKYLKLLEEEGQLDLYNEYYRPSMVAMLKLKMQGLTLDKKKVYDAYDELDTLIESDIKALQEFPQVKEVILELNKKAQNTYNSTHKKQKTLEEFNEEFNPSSTQHKRILLLDVLGLHIDKLTKTGEPSTDKEVLNELLTSTSGATNEILQMISDVGQASIIRNTFLNAFKELGIDDGLGNFKLYGNYKLFGLVSGRISSDSPNMMNLPSTGSKYAKLIKSCIVPDEGFIIATADLSSLEDRVMASISNCKSKIYEYEAKLDGHSFRAAAYFKSILEERGIMINMDDPSSVNSVKDLAPDLRQESKAPTFAMAYGGSHKPVMNALKCSKSKAEGIVEAYKALYPELEEFAEETLHLAKTQGYVQGFFGLKLRCPNIRADDRETTSKMGRTLGNMRIQSSAMLTVQAVRYLQELIENMGLVKDVKINATIHDSIYLMIRPTPDVLQFVNTNLIKFMCLPYDGVIVPNEASLDIGTSWKDLKGIPNHNDTLDYEGILNDI